ncbi:putative translation initiation factor eIF-2B subunit delta [Smittium mucronatum]|uniref:Translation initiation factor eIF2B subunit delta n=1 Tax=Smittium mucronatum TaxID=133383 RepID=A0A1R0GNI2_9FUNG|nr:putative translation initiation factor eIF-2B subunit delta [Smittium mucronatum]
MEDKTVTEKLQDLDLNPEGKTKAELKAERARLHKLRLEKQGIIDHKQSGENLDPKKDLSKKPALSKQERRAIQEAQREAKAKAKGSDVSKRGGTSTSTNLNTHDDKNKNDRIGLGIGKDLSSLGKLKGGISHGSILSHGTPEIGGGSGALNGTSKFPNYPSFGPNLRENEMLLESAVINSKKIRMFEHLEVPNDRVFSGHVIDKWRPSSLMAIGYDEEETDVNSNNNKISVPGVGGSVSGSTAPSTISKRKKDFFQIHPAIKSLGLRMASSMLEGSNERTKAMLEAFSLIIYDYKTPPQNSMARHLQTYLNPQIKFLVQQRPLSVGMGNAIRWLKEKISLVDIDQDEASTKKELITNIRNYVNERISAAVESIAVNGSAKINDGDVVLTYSHSSAVFRLLTHAFSVNKTKFSVIVIDSRVGFSGQKMVRKLVASGMARNPDVLDSLSMYDNSRKCSSSNEFMGCGVSYALITSLGYVMKQANKVILGAEAMLGNGAILSRSGTAMVALAARNYHVPLLVACETYKFTERVQLDSVVNNELGNPESLVILPNERNSNWMKYSQMDRNLNSKDDSSCLLISNTLNSLSYSPLSSDRFSAWPNLNNRRTLPDPTKPSSNQIGVFGGNNTGNLAGSTPGSGGPPSNWSLETLTPNLQILSKDRAVNNMTAVAASLSVSSKINNNSIYNKSSVLDPVDKELANAKWEIFENENPLVNWRELTNLKILDITRDITPSEFVSVVVTEVGLIPTTSISVLLREYKI